MSLERQQTISRMQRAILNSAGYTYWPLLRDRVRAGEHNSPGIDQSRCKRSCVGHLSKGSVQKMIVVFGLEIKVRSVYNRDRQLARAGTTILSQGPGLAGLGILPGFYINCIQIYTIMCNIMYLSKSNNSEILLQCFGNR